MNTPFSEITFFDAVARAKAEQKAIFAYFYTRSSLKEQTGLTEILSIHSIKEWIEQSTVPVSICLDDGQSKFNGHDIRSLPNCLIFAPNTIRIGEIGTTSEISDPEHFLNLAKHYVNGEGTLPYAKRKAEEGHPANALNWLNLAEAYSEWGYDKEAENILLDWVQRRAEYRHSISYIHGAFLYGTFLVCSERHEQLICSFRNRRDELKNEIIKSNFRDNKRILIYARINKLIDDHSNTIEMFKQLKASQPGLVDTLFTFVVLDGGGFTYPDENYLEISKQIDLVDLVDSCLGTYREEANWIHEAEQDLGYEMWNDRLDSYFRLSLCGIYYALLATGQPEQASEVANRLIACMPSAESYEFLSRFGLRSGNPQPESLEFAKKAVELDPTSKTSSGALRKIIHSMLKNQEFKLEERSELEAILSKLDETYGRPIELPDPTFETRVGNKIIRTYVTRINLKNED